MRHAATCPKAFGLELRLGMGFSIVSGEGAQCAMRPMLSHRGGWSLVVDLPSRCVCRSSVDSGGAHSFFLACWFDVSLASAFKFSPPTLPHWPFQGLRAECCGAASSRHSVRPRVGASHLMGGGCVGGSLVVVCNLVAVVALLAPSPCCAQLPSANIDRQFDIVFGARLFGLGLQGTVPP